MDRRFLTVLGVSLVFALVVSSVFYQMTARSSGPSKKAEATDQKDVVVADAAPGRGRDGQAGRRQSRQVPRDAFPKGAFSKVEDVLDRPVISNMLLDEPMLEGRLAAKGSGLGLAPTIPVGMRAVTVRVNDVAGVAGFVLPGMHVDVLVTGRPPNGDGNMTTTCLQNMLVLSAGQTMQAGCARPGHSSSDGDAAGDAGAGRDPDAGQQRRTHPTGAAQFERPDASRRPRAGTSANSTARRARPPRRSAPAAPRPRPRPVVIAAAPPPPPPPPPPPDQIVVIRGTHQDCGNHAQASKN